MDEYLLFEYLLFNIHFLLIGEKDVLLNTKLKHSKTKFEQFFFGPNLVVFLYFEGSNAFKFLKF